MKKIKTICICLLIILFISNIIFLTKTDGGSLIKYEDNQNTDTIVEVLQVMGINISSNVHIKEIIHERSFHNFKLNIKYIENGEEKAINDVAITGNGTYENYFINNGINITKTIREPIQKIYFLLYTIIVITLIAIMYYTKKKRN